MTTAEPDFALSSLPPFGENRALLWARLTGGFFVIHHVLFGLLMLVGGAGTALMFVTLSTSGFWALLALVVSLKMSMKGLNLWHFNSMADEDTAQDITPALIYAWYWSRPLSIFGYAAGLLGLACLVVPALVSLGVWLFLTALAALLYALALRHAFPEEGVSRKEQRRKNNAAAETPRARRRKKRDFSREAVVIAIIPMAIVHNWLIPVLGLSHPSSALGSVLYYGMMIGFILVTAVFWTGLRARTEETV